MPGCRRGCPVAKRQTKRKVVIRLTNRIPDDPRSLLLAGEEAFRPGEIEIRVEAESPEKAAEGAPSLPNEQLEIAAMEHAAEVLDEKDQRIQGVPAIPTKIEVVEKVGRVRAWVAARSQSGW